MLRPPDYDAQVEHILFPLAAVDRLQADDAERAEHGEQPQPLPLDLEELRAKQPGRHPAFLPVVCEVICRKMRSSGSFSSSTRYTGNPSWTSRATAFATRASVRSSSTSHSPSRSRENPYDSRA